MKNLGLAVILFLSVQSAFAEQGFKCNGKQLDKWGNTIGYGDFTVTVKENGQALYATRAGLGAPLKITELIFEGYDTSKGLNVYNTNATTGIGVAIHKANLSAHLYQQVNLMVSVYSPRGVSDRSVYNCFVYKSNYL